MTKSKEPTVGSTGRAKANLSGNTLPVFGAEVSIRQFVDEQTKPHIKRSLEHVARERAALVDQANSASEVANKALLNAAQSEAQLRGLTAARGTANEYQMWASAFIAYAKSESRKAPFGEMAKLIAIWRNALSQFLLQDTAGFVKTHFVYHGEILNIQLWMNKDGQRFMRYTGRQNSAERWVFALGLIMMNRLVFRTFARQETPDKKFCPYVEVYVMSEGPAVYLEKDEEILTALRERYLAEVRPALGSKFTW
jgi:hypothetical protein